MNYTEKREAIARDYLAPIFGRGVEAQRLDLNLGTDEFYFAMADAILKICQPDMENLPLLTRGEIMNYTEKRKRTKLEIRQAIIWELLDSWNKHKASGDVADAILAIPGLEIRQPHNTDYPPVRGLAGKLREELNRTGPA